MKIVKQRNSYLKRTSSQQPHKYSYDLDSGKYFLIAEDGSHVPINKNGSHPSKFRKNFTGFISHKQRYEASKLDKTALHFTPDLEYKTEDAYYTPVTRKFLGYAQYPYRMKGRKDPGHLNNPDKEHVFKRSKSTKQEPELQNRANNFKKSESIILQNTAKTFITKGVDDHYFQKSFTSMTQAKPLPKFYKKTCYNYKCKYLRNFTFDMKEKTENSTRISNQTNNSWVENTMGKSFYDKQILREKKQQSMLSTGLG